MATVNKQLEQLIYEELDKPNITEMLKKKAIELGASFEVVYFSYALEAYDQLEAIKGNNPHD